MIDELSAKCLSIYDRIYNNIFIQRTLIALSCFAFALFSDTDDTSTSLTAASSTPIQYREKYDYSSAAIVIEAEGNHRPINSYVDSKDSLKHNELPLPNISNTKK